MNVSELRKALTDLPDDMDVMLDVFNDEFRYSMAEKAAVTGVRFEAPDIPKKDWPTIPCLVITDQI